MNQKRTLLEKIEEILKDHESHSPIYTCRLQISNALLKLFLQTEEETVKAVIGNKKLTAVCLREGCNIEHDKVRNKIINAYREEILDRYSQIRKARE